MMMSANIGSGRRSRVCLAAAALLTISAHAWAGPPVWYVDASAPPGGDGTSWATAFNDLQAAVSSLSPSSSLPVPTQMWVRAGTYIPTVFAQGEPRLKSFFLKNNLAILGGFDGTETSADQRDPDANITILSGDIGVPGDASDNSVRLIWVGSVSNNTAVLDGFTIAGANANISYDRGAGLFCEGTPTFRNCTFLANNANWQGSAVYSTKSLIFENCKFIDNTGAPQGGTVHFHNPSGQPQFNDCEFRGNVGSQSVVNGPNRFRRCLFIDNVSVSSNFGVSFVECDFISNDRGNINAGSTQNLDVVRCRFIENGRNDGNASAIFTSNSSGTVNIYNCEFFGNFASGNGGAMQLGGNQNNIINCLVVGNTCGSEGGGVYFTGGTSTIANCTIAYNECGFSAAGVRGHDVTVDNCILWGNERNGVVDQSSQIALTGAGAVRYNCIHGLAAPYIGNGNTGANPDFFDALGADLHAGTDDDDFRLAPASPCVDAGRNNSVFADGFDLDGDFIIFEFVPLDVHDNPRFFDVVRTADVGEGSAPIVDIGALESDGSIPSDDPGLFVGPSGGSWFVPSNWAGNVVPNASTNVTIATRVTIDQPGAEAAGVNIVAGGALTIDGGTLHAFTGVVVESDGSLIAQSNGALLTSPLFMLQGGANAELNDLGASFDLGTFQINTGATFAWTAGSVTIATLLSSGETINIGCASAATLTLQNTATLEAPVVQVCAAGIFNAGGDVNCSILNDGRVNVGNSIGTLNIDGQFIQGPAGTLEIEMEGYIAGVTYDQIIVTGEANLDGTLELIALPGFAPVIAGDQRIIISTDDSVEGEFATVNQPTLAPGFFFDVTEGIATPDGIFASVRLLTLLDASSPRLYVDADAPAGGNGQNWASAARDLAGALSFAHLVNTGAHDIGTTIDEVWVAEGTYTPDGGTGDRKRFFKIGPGVEVYGGFDGTETALEQRDVVANVTIMSGDLLGDDGPPGSFTNYSDNAFRVVAMQCTGFPCPNPPTLDGFTITAGNADGTSGNNTAAGVAGADGAVIAHCRFLYHYATSGGTALSMGSGSLVKFCEFIGNNSLFTNAAVQTGNECVIEDSLFQANTGERTCISSATTGNLLIQRCTFQQNTGNRAVFIRTNEFFLTQIIDCDFISNAPQPGAAAVVWSEPTSVLDMHGCTFSDNTAISLFSRGNLTLSTSLFQNNLDTPLLSNQSAQVTNTNFIGNATIRTNSSGGANVDGGAATFTHCDFLENVGTQGGALNVGSAGSSATLNICTIADNSSTDLADGIYNLGSLQFGSDVVISDDVVNVWQLFPGGPAVVGTMILPDGFSNAVVVFTPTDVRFGTVHVDVAGLLPGTLFDRIDAAPASVTIEGGTLQLDMMNGFVPADGDQLDVITAGAISGIFDVATSPAALPAGLAIDVDYQPDAVTAAFRRLFEVEPATLMLPSLPIKAALADLTGDGLDDLLVLYAGADVLADPGQLVVHRNAGFVGEAWQGFEARGDAYTIGADPRDILLAQLNGDSAIDVAIPNAASDSVSILLNDGTGTLVPGTNVAVDANLIAAGVVPNAAHAANLVIHAYEFEKKDPKSADETLRVYINDGAALFTHGQVMDPPDNATLQIRAVDVDLDDDLDLVALHGSANPAIGDDQDVTIWTYDAGSELYQELQTRPVGSDAAQLVVADVNSDGFPDLLTEDFSELTISILHNTADGTGLFHFRETLVAGTDTKSLHAIDHDQDVDADLLLIAKGSADAPVMRSIRNDGAHFATAGDVGAAGAPLLLVAGFVDADARPDAVVFSASAALTTAGELVDVLAYRNVADLAVCLGDLVSSSTFQPPPDGQVDGADLAYLLGDWGANPGSLADIVTSATFQPPADGIVNGADLAVLLGAWGPCD